MTNLRLTANPQYHDYIHDLILKADGSIELLHGEDQSMRDSGKARYTMKLSPDGESGTLIVYDIQKNEEKQNDETQEEHTVNFKYETGIWKFLNVGHFCRSDDFFSEEIIIFTKQYVFECDPYMAVYAAESDDDGTSDLSNLPAATIPKSTIPLMTYSQPCPMYNVYFDMSSRRTMTIGNFLNGGNELDTNIVCDYDFSYRGIEKSIPMLEEYILKLLDESHISIFRQLAGEQPRRIPGQRFVPRKINTHLNCLYNKQGRAIGLCLSTFQKTNKITKIYKKNVFNEELLGKEYIKKVYTIKIFDFCCLDDPQLIEYLLRESVKNVMRWDSCARVMVDFGDLITSENRQLIRSTLKLQAGGKYRFTSNWMDY